MMNALLSFLIPFRHSPEINFRLRKQLPFIAITTLSMLVMFSLLLPLFIISTRGKITIFTLILLCLIVMLCSAIVLLRKQQYLGAARLVSMTLFSSCMAVLFIMPYSGGVYEAYRPFAFMVTICTCNVLVSLEKKQIILFFSGVLSGWILVFLTIFRPFLETTRALTISIFLTCLLGLVIVNMVLLFIKNLSDDLLETAQKETEAAQVALGNMTKVMQEARDGMAIGEQILDASSKVQKSLEEVEKIQFYLSGSSDSLVKESENFTISSGSVLDSARAMKDNLQEQNSAITETSAAITQISANLASISGIATKRRDMLTEISQAGSAQKELVKKLLDAVASVQKSSEGINVFVSLVQDVASRTGLLSMNASIEAARAGTSGKGFAVIAQEIRALSEETQKNAGTIKTLLGENEKTVESTNVMMKEFSQFIEKNVQYTNSLTESIDEILRGITEMDTGTREVMQAAQDIVTAAQDSNEMVNSVVSRVDSQKAGFGHIAGFSSELYQRIKLLDKSVKEIRSASDLVAQAGRLNTEQVKKLQMHITD